MLNRLASVYMELIVVFIVKQKMTCFNQRTEKGRRMKILWVSLMRYLLSHNILCFKTGTIARRVARGDTGSEIRETGGPEPCLCLVTLWPWASHLTSLSFNFLIEFPLHWFLGRNKQG